MIDQFLNISTGLFLIKASFLLLTGIFFVFLIVVLKQSFAMRAVINDDPASSVISSVALFNLFVGFSLFVAALLVL